MRCLPAAALALFAPSRADTRGARAQSYRGDRCRTSSGQPGQGHGRRLRQRHPGARLQEDPDGSVSLDPEITLPRVSLDPEITLSGFKVVKPVMRITSNTCPTNFGDLAEPQGDTYSRVTLSVAVTRPLVAMSVKTFVPIVLIVICVACGRITSRAASVSASWGC